jgi:hypothetical protein
VWPAGTGECEIREETVQKAKDQDDEVESTAEDQNLGELREETAELKRTNKLDMDSENPEDIKTQITRLKRAFDKRVHDWKLGAHTEEMPKVEPIRKHRIRIRVRADNRNAVVPYIRHGRVQEVSFDWEMPPNKFRKMLVRIFKLNGLVWQLEKRKTADSDGFERAEIGFLQKSLNQGDEARIRTVRTKKKMPNAPGTS